MKAGKFLICALMLLAVSIFVCFADFYRGQRNGVYGQEQAAITYLDTVYVIECTKLPFVQVDENKGEPEEKRIGTTILALFSNNLIFKYLLLDKDFKQEFAAKGVDHIYNIMAGDIVVVKVEDTPEDKRIVEFVANLSAK